MKRKKMKVSELKEIIQSLPDDMDVIIDESKLPRGPFAEWEVWEGWSGNHDQRIDGATCSICGYEHATVYGSMSKLGRFCPGCGATMTNAK